MHSLRKNCNGRFLSRLFTLLFVWLLAIVALFQFRESLQSVTPLSSVGGRLLLQKRLESVPLTRHIDTTTLAIDREPDVDKSPRLSEDKLVEEVQARLPSLPIAYWNKMKNKPMSINSTCARFPSIYELEFNNIYWQTLHTTNGTFQFYGAYFDNRAKNSLGPTIRIIGMINRISPTVVTHCQIWFDDLKVPVIVKTFEYKYIWHKSWGNYKQGIYQPYLISCPLPKTHNKKIPSSVSVVEKMCDNSTNNLRVIYEKPKEKKNFAVCVKGLDFLHEDLSVRLVEWIELLGFLGADKIFFYELQVHPNITKVLKYYESIGKVQSTPISLAGGQPNVPAFQHLYLTKKINNKRQNELIPYNDCFYKHMYEYHYIALLDIDEVIMPLNSMTWKELVFDTVVPKALKLKPELAASFNVRNVYFLDDLLHNHGWIKDVPKYMHMLQHVYRSKNFTKPNQYVKCFHNTEKVLTLHNHFPMSCLGSVCTSYPIPTSDAQLQHYRADCVRTLKKTCVEYRGNSVMDTTIWKYKDALISKVTATLKNLGFFSENKTR